MFNIEHSSIEGMNVIIDCKRYSSLLKLLRVTCYVRRFVGMLKSKIAKLDFSYPPDFTRSELDDVKQLWVKAEQKMTLSNEKRVKELTYLLGLFKDDSDVLRLQGRTVILPN